MLKRILFMGVIALAITSCSNGPKEAARGFSENLAKGKIEEAKKYATESTGKMIDLASSFGKMPIDPNFKFEFVKDSIVENKAWVTFIDEKGKEQVLDLYKIDGKWLVNMKSKK